MRRVLTLIASAVLVVACSPAPETPVGAQPSGAARPADAGAAGPANDATALLEAIDADTERVLRELSQVDYVVQRRLMSESGVEAEIGGPHAADQALQSLMIEVRKLAMAEMPRWRPVDASGQVDGALGIAAASVELAGLLREAKELYGDGQAKQDHRTWEGNRAELDVGDGNLSYTSDKAAITSELRGRFTTLFKANVCPDANGQVTIDVTSQSTMSTASGSKGANTTVRVVLNRDVTDNAEYGEFDAQTHVESAMHGGGSGTFVDLDTGTSSRDSAGNSRTVNRRSDRATDADVGNAADLGNILYTMALAYSEFVAGVWKGGACVKLEPTSDPAKRSGVEPSTQFSVLAAPRSKVDGTASGGTVKATLSGGSSLSPSGTPVRADATFTYVAPDEKEKSATVSFEARSKRGIGKAELSFDTREAKQAYDIDGGADEFHGTGTACDLSQQFFVQGSGVTVRFEPSSREGGRYSYSGSMSGFAVWGNGNYAVAYQGDVAVSMTAEGPGSVKTPKGTFTRNGSEKYTLTPHGGDCG